MLIAAMPVCAQTPIQVEVPPADEPPSPPPAPPPPPVQPPPPQFTFGAASSAESTAPPPPPTGSLPRTSKFFFNDPSSLFGPDPGEPTSSATTSAATTAAPGNPWGSASDSSNPFASTGGLFSKENVEREKKASGKKEDIWEPKPSLFSMGPPGGFSGEPAGDFAVGQLVQVHRNDGSWTYGKIMDYEDLGGTYSVMTKAGPKYMVERDTISDDIVVNPATGECAQQ